MILIKKKEPEGGSYSLYGTPKGNRTPDSTVRGWRLDRLTIGAYFFARFELCYYNTLAQENQEKF